MEKKHDKILKSVILLMMGAGMEVEFPKVLSSSKFFRNFYPSLGLLYIKKNLSDTRNMTWLRINLDLGRKIFHT